MKTMDKDQLMDQLAQRGYALMRPKSTEPGEKVLVSLLQQDEVRLLEGFPVVLAGLLKEKETLTWENKKWHPSNDLSKKTEHRLAVMLSLSYLLFKLFGFEKEYGPRTLKLLFRCEGGTELLKQLTKSFLNSESAKMDTLELSPERLKNNFRNYVVHHEESQEVHEKRHALEFDLLLSELFTSRQKELLKKRLEEKPMTKTEKEYFYRVVSKRLKALANEELHALARRLVSK